MAYMNILKFHSVQLPPMNCKVIITNPDRSYTSGDTIAGELFLSCQKDIYSFGLKVSLEGRGMVKFKDQGSQSKSEVILETSTYVYGKGEEKVRLQPGKHTFPFTLEIPRLSSLPGSFRSSFGLIIYQIVAYVQLEWKLVRKSEKTLNISSYLNLSQEFGLCSPISYEKSEKFLLPSLISRRLTPQFRLNFRMTHSGFLRGEEIPFEFELDNPSTYEILSLVASLVQKITYSAGSASKVKLKVISRVETENMDSPNGTVWTHALSVPWGMLPNQKGIIDIAYSIKIEVKPGSQVCHLRGEVPITIGTTRDSLVTTSTVRNSNTTVDGSKSDEGLLLRPTKGSKGRERSPSPCPLSGARSSGGGRACHKSLDRADTVTSHSNYPCPPRYSVLSIRSSSVETLPPTYEEIAKEDNSPLTSEFKKFAEQQEQEDEENADVDDFDEDEQEVDSNVEKLAERVLSTVTTGEKSDVDSSSKL